MSVPALGSQVQKPAQNSSNESPTKAVSTDGPSSTSYTRSTISTAEPTSFAPSSGLPPRAPIVTKPGVYYYNPGKGKKLVTQRSMVNDPAAEAPKANEVPKPKMSSQDIQDDSEFKAKEKEDSTDSPPSQGRRKKRSSSVFNFDPNGKTRFTN